MTRDEEARAIALKCAVKLKAHNMLMGKVTDTADEFYKFIRGRPTGPDIVPPDPRQGGPDPHDMH